MQLRKLRVVVSLITFFIGLSVVFIWYFNRQTDFYIPEIDAPTDIEKKVEVKENDLHIRNEDYAVYTAILNEPTYKNELIVINDFTSHGLIADAKNLGDNTSDFDKETIQDYQLKNEYDEKLENNFATEYKVLFLSKNEESQMFDKKKDGWAIFHKKFPKAKGIISFSRIGFNKDQTKALVSVSFGCDWLCGEGNFIYLSKENDKWAVIKTSGLWVS